MAGTSISDAGPCLVYPQPPSGEPGQPLLRDQSLLRQFLRRRSRHSIPRPTSWDSESLPPDPPPASLPRACTDSSLFALRGMDHCADDLLAETRLLELQEIVRVELELGRRDFDLIDDDLVAKSGLFELEHIRVG